MVVAEECEIIAVAARPTAALSLNIFIGFLPFVFLLTMTSRDVIEGDAFRFTPKCQAYLLAADARYRAGLTPSQLILAH